MIIRRRHTKNFATISNTLADDARLGADELGVMYYLLSRSHNWEVRRPQLMKRFNFGRETMRRVVRDCMMAGWIIAERTRLSNGTFSTIYEVRDEPGPALTEAEVKALLTVGSTVATDDDGCAEESETDHEPDHGPPDPGTAQPDAADRGRLAGGGKPDMVLLKKDLPNTDSTKTNPTKAVPVFDDLRRVWPSGDILSLSQCEHLFASLPSEERQMAFDGVSQYLANTRAKNRKLCDLSKYLKERRFVEIQPITVGHQCFGNTPQAFRWTEYWKSMGKTFALHHAEAQWKIGRPAYTETEWPPPLHAAAAE